MTDKRSRLQPRFDAIEKAGGIKMPNLKKGSGISFTAMERHKATFSIWAGLFTILYYGYHGVWKKGISLLVIGTFMHLSLTYLLLAMSGFINPFLFSGVLLSITPFLFALRAPANLYSKYVLNENGWNPF